MKKYEVVFKSELKALIFKIVICVLFVLCAGLFAIEASVFFTIFFSLFLFLRYRSLTAQYKITEEGISNRLIKLDWKSIKRCKVFYPCKQYRVRNIKGSREYPPVICMGELLSDESVFWQSGFKSVIIPITQRNLKLIDKYWQNKSPEMQAILDQYSGYPDYPDKWDIWWQ